MGVGPHRVKDSALPLTPLKPTRDPNFDDVYDYSDDEGDQYN